MTRKKQQIARLETGVRNLDALFGGGLPKGSVVVIGGPPGSGKTILTQQVCFHLVSPNQRVLYFNTLSEPTAKTLRHMSQFGFFDPDKLDNGSMTFVDLGVILRAKGLEEAIRLIMEHVKQTRPAIVVVDSFKVFDDLAQSGEELRKFSYELIVTLMAWETTTLLLGEYAPFELSTSPLFSIADGLVHMTQRVEWGEQQRFIRVSKLRGTAHSRDEHAFVIRSDGLEVFAPRLTIQRTARDGSQQPPSRLETGIAKLDDLLGEGIPRGSSLLVSGVAGTGKTVLLMEFLYRGAEAGEKGIIFTFEETDDRLRAAARGLGWDLDGQIARGMIEIVFVPQPDILVEEHLLMIQERTEAMQARRVAIDSVSVFLHKITDPQIAREKTFQLATIVQNVQAVGFFATDIPYGSQQLSRFGVEETVVDGVILLSATESGLGRQRYLEIYKLRNTAHLKGRHNMEIESGGITIFPRYGAEPEDQEPPAPIESSRRLPSGVPGLDALCGGGLLDRSVTLVSGSAGIGKSTLGIQFVIEGAKRGEPGLYIALEEGPAQILVTATGLDLPLEALTKEGSIELLYLPRERVRASQFLAILDDRIRKQKTRRLVLDSISHLVREGDDPDELRQLLYAMAVRFKARGVTSLLTLEAASMYAIDTITERGYSPIADNILMLRYRQSSGGTSPTLSVVKTRGSAHDRGTWPYTIESGGIRIGERALADGGAGSTDDSDRPG